jgi:polysaccharide deacetylase family protein (PEP-CTERM system associated)
MDRRTFYNAMTVDVEDYFQVSALAKNIDRSQWELIPCRIERNIDKLLYQFDRYDAKATFFTLGWIAQRYPQMIRRIVTAGHELASHGFSHLRATEQAHAEFLSDVTDSKKLLEDISGMLIHGYRAPSFSIGRNNLWAFDCLQQAGYSYSSSVYPIKHDHYGMVEASRFPYIPTPGLTELPITTIQLLGRNFPVGGGGYFRLLPYGLSRWAIERFNHIEGRPAIFYMHPWEIDPGQPRVAGLDWKSQFRHYVNLGKTESRLVRLLNDFRWDRLDRVFGLVNSDAQPNSATTPAKELAFERKLSGAVTR